MLSTAAFVTSAGEKWHHTHKMGCILTSQARSKINKKTCTNYTIAQWELLCYISLFYSQWSTITRCCLHGWCFTQVLKNWQCCTNSHVQPISLHLCHSSFLLCKRVPTLKQELKTSFKTVLPQFCHSPLPHSDCQPHPSHQGNSTHLLSVRLAQYKVSCSTHTLNYQIVLCMQDTEYLLPTLPESW